MAIKVTNQNPGTISSVGPVQTGKAYVSPSTVYTSNPINVVSNYGMQPSPFSLAPLKLGAVGSKPATVNPNPTPNPNDSATAALRSEIQRLTAMQNAIPRPAKIDIAGINARARAEAEAAVNPLYTKKLNDYLAKNALEKQRGQENYNTAVANIDEQVQNALKDSETNRTRTAEDTTANIDAVNLAQDQYQTDTGAVADESRLAMARDLARAGVAGPGAGAQALDKASTDQNTQEVRAGQDAEAKKVTQNILKARTFDDLATADTRTTATGEKNKTSANVDLHRLMEDLTMEEGAQRTLLESQRYMDLFQNQSSQAKKLFNEYLTGISDPNVLAATASAYGGMF